MCLLKTCWWTYFWNGDVMFYRWRLGVSWSACYGARWSGRSSYPNTCTNMYMWLPFAGTMPRTYTKKTDRVRTPLDVLTRASEAVAQGGTYTSVAKEFSIDRMKLKRFIWKEKLQGPATSAGYEYLSRLKSVFNDRQESDLAEHLKALCNRYYGLSVVKCRCLAYEFATKNNVNMPDNWARDGKAGVEWMMSF